VYDCPQPMLLMLLMLLMLNIHHTRVLDIVVPDHIVTTPLLFGPGLSRRVWKLVQPDRKKAAAPTNFGRA
jgi:hypothetical protein